MEESKLLQHNINNNSHKIKRDRGQAPEEASFSTSLLIKDQTSALNLNAANKFKRSLNNFHSNHHQIDLTTINTTMTTRNQLPISSETHHQTRKLNSNVAANNNNNNATTNTPNINNNNSKNKKLFPQKLWELINDETYNFCLRWSADGQLVYLDRDEFEHSYLKTEDNQFHTHKAISFVRQMNMYGFRKVDDCYYENDNFKRDCEHLLKNMIRKHPNKNNNINNLSATNLITTHNHHKHNQNQMDHHKSIIGKVTNFSSHPYPSGSSSSSSPFDAKIQAINTLQDANFDTTTNFIDGPNNTLIEPIAGTNLPQTMQLSGNDQQADTAAAADSILRRSSNNGLINEYHQRELINALIFAQHQQHLLQQQQEQQQEHQHELIENNLRAYFSRIVIQILIELNKQR